MYALTDTHGCSRRDWLSSGRVPLNDPSNRAFFRDPGDLWLADRFTGDSFPLASTLSESLFHPHFFFLPPTLVPITLLGDNGPFPQTLFLSSSHSVLT